MQTKNNNNKTTTNEGKKILGLIAKRIYISHQKSISLDDKQLNDVFASNVSLYIKFFTIIDKNQQNSESYAEILNQIKSG